MYLRFAVPSDPHRPPWERDLLVDETDWFNRHVPVPGQIRRGRAVYWFRDDAREAISRAWRIAWLVEGIGIPVRVYCRNRPGTICYEDAFQVAALPWRTTFRA